MTVQALERELLTVGRVFGRWQADLRGSLWLAGLAGALLLFALADVALHLGQGVRLVLWLGWLAAAGTAVWHLAQALRAARTPDGVASRLEKGFPELDNRLINYLQFARQEEDDAFVRAYLAEGVPAWRGRDLAVMKDRKRHRKVHLAAAGAFAALLAPFLFLSEAWFNSLLRVVNPFTHRSPSLLARIELVTPGDAKVLAGRSILVACEVRGKSGQPVWLDWSARDGEPRTERLGETKGGATERFVFNLERVTAPVTYRFRAADDRSAEHRIDVVPPLALSSVEAMVTPRAYTGLPPATQDVLKAPLPVLAGSRVEFKAVFNRPVKAVAVRAARSAAAWDGTSADGAAWAIPMPSCTNSQLRLVAQDEWEGEFTADLAVQMTADQGPAVRIVAPRAAVRLSPGGMPRIEFTVEDDFGVGEVRLEAVSAEDAAGAAAATARVWRAGGTNLFAAEWDGPALPKGRLEAAYRVVAADNAEPPHEGTSPVVVFQSAEAPAKEDPSQAAARAVAALEQLIRLQQENLDRTRRLAGLLAESTAAQWGEAAAVQLQIRSIAGRLLEDPARPLGALSTAVRELHTTAMPEAADALGRIPAAPAERKPAYAAQAIQIEERILRVLTRISAGAEAADKQRRTSDLLAMMDMIIGGQEGVVAGAKAAAERGAKVGQALVEQEDRLAGDVHAFVKVCRTEAEGFRHTDADFSQVVTKVADGCGEKKIPETMLLAAEQLDQDKPREAGPFAGQALASLKELRALLDQWRVADATERVDEIRQAVGEAKDRMQKIAKLQSKLVESLKEVKVQKDHSGKEYEEKMEELQEIKEDVAEAALQVAKDLHIFPELPVGNELVEDISQIFEETAQVEGSEKAPAEELGLQKEDWILDLLEQQTDRLDDMEMWLPSKPDALKRLTENFDQQEMPEIPVVPLGQELQDIIGDLLEQQEEISDKADDSATNQGSADMPAGWGIEEGEFANFSAKGKSGSNRPDHNEQTGRSLVGRQGQADGETTAGSGSIAEGDNNLEARRTQDGAQSGQVQIEGQNDAKATGGGKLAGYDNEYGMAGSGPRRDAATGSSPLGMQALLRRQAEQVYAKATLLHVRTATMDEAILLMRRAEDALAQGYPIQQVHEFQRRAAAALRRARAELGGGYVDQGAAASESALLDDPLASSPDEAPARYRDVVSEYFKSLGRE